ncbi:PREDICTED: major centromere autoantigen B-like [Diuraphis noxia]|uniref:major centromere autoantigen B-like n=1 Tax=Diuraphis noxia TaxID=143948 RepID=UPI000763AB8F|nr:PREDICTED: major centromere autoantigen B-like [Diuraphis noxia]
MSLKISRKALSLTDKLSILHKYDSNPSLEKTKLAESLNISESTLRTIIVKRKEIEKRAIEGSNKRKKIKHGKYYNLEQILIHWINKKYASSAPLNGPIIQRQALKIAKSLKITDFKATNGWLDRFKKRNLICYRSVTRKCNPLLHFKNKRIRTCCKNKLSRELLKVLICANSDGTEKLNPLVIGKPLKPKRFIDNESFPCEYSVKDTTLTDNEHFGFWIKKLDETMIKNNRKILLIVDNSSTIQKDIVLENVELIFFPPYITKNLQPMNLGVINVLKHYYEEHHLNVLKNSDIKQLNIILNALRHITAAWSSIQPQVIAECFKKAGIDCFSNKVIENTANEPMGSIKNTSTHLKKTSGKNLMTIEHKYVLSSEDLVNIAEEDDIDEDFDTGENESLSNAINAIKILRRYLPTLKGSEAAIDDIDRVEHFIFSKMPHL